MQHDDLLLSVSLLLCFIIFSLWNGPFKRTSSLELRPQTLMKYDDSF